MTRTIFNTALLAVTLAVPVSAFALESDRRQPIQIEADQGSLDQANQVTTFSGNVIIKQGSLHINAGSVRVSRNSRGEQTISASGRPVRFGQTLDGGKGTVNGQADRVEYASATNIVNLIGNAKVQRGGDSAEGAAITYNTRTEVYTVNGSKAAGMSGNRRVTVVIQPSGK
ncbi:lipopolysaccharide transport periplasmic protein LptA [Neisseria montereyensis]|uniref:Lipopolysaccharide export system protein LptA n=1 Tax=Neisseria montereyensis TaxID=2973938 RepID=A0ABT2FDM3_9NEIS|nr:lipopolysaccharide transport periplasmic protein LptA [Neisseria montereyensis]MCS4534309.1 lipopolysaccharide transport periplasmic protein LptA [Neisseria montereyensis]